MADASTMVERVAKAIADKLTTPGASTTDVAKAAIAATGLNELREALAEYVAAREAWFASTTDAGDEAAAKRLDAADKAARAALSRSEGDVG